jgi:hypothetical protein
LGVQLVEQTYNAKVTVLPLDLSADEALARIPKDTDAVYLTPAMRMNTDEWQQVMTASMPASCRSLL